MCSSLVREYRNEVKNLTKKAKKELLENWNGYDFYDNEYIKDNFNLDPTHKNYPTIDHKISVHYGFNNNILMQSFADMLKNLSNEEIEMYSSSIGNLDGYTIEDYRSVKEILLDFKNKYKL